MTVNTEHLNNTSSSEVSERKEALRYSLGCTSLTVKLLKNLAEPPGVK